MTDLSRYEYYRTENGVLYHGDCLEILPHLEPVDLVLTDPQYQLANGKKAKTNNVCRGEKYLKGITTKSRDWGCMYGDDKPFKPIPFMVGKEHIFWGAIHYANEFKNSTSWLIWDKRDGVEPDDNADCECAWSDIGGPARIFRHLWKGVCRAGEENLSIQGAKHHPFQKPIALMMWCLEKSKTTGTVLDPFLGSGTTAVACERLGRKWVGIELEERYCRIAVDRIKKETQQLRIPGC